MIIKMPKEITTYSQYEEWVKSQANLQVSMKQRTNFYPYAFTIENKEGTEVDYLISDSVSRGRCKVKNFNRVFKFQIED